MRDVRYAARGLRRSPAFSLNVILTLSLGIGANAAMFDVTDRLMFRPLENLRDPGTVHRLYQHSLERGAVVTDHWVSYGRYEDFRRWTHTFSTIAGFNERVHQVGRGELARERQVAAVSASFFDLFDAPAVQGRYFGPDEDVAPTGTPVSVLAHAFWQHEYGGRHVLGETLQVGSLTTTIIGVAHPALRGVNDATPPAVFVPITAAGPIYGGQIGAQQSVGYRNLWGSLLVRRKPGISIDEAARDATQALQRSWDAQRQAQPGTDRPTVDKAQPRVTVGGVRPGAGPAPALEVRTAMWVTGVAVIVLLIACANLGNLMLSRAIARQHEIATLTALGASRGRLLTRALAETCLLALTGAAGAVAVAQWSVTAIFSILVPNAVDLLPVTSPRTLAVTGFTALTAATVLGVLPMLVMRPVTAGSSTAAARGATTRTSRLRAGLVVVQAALSLVLLVGAVLFTRSLDAVKTMPYGYDAERILLVNTIFRGPMLPVAERGPMQQRLLDAAKALPGVEAAAWRLSTPLGLNASLRFFVDGIPSVGDLGAFTAQSGTEDIFAAMGTKILRGRGFTAADAAGAEVVVVSNGMANALWPGQDPIGRCLRFGSASGECTRVVGVAEDIVQTSITAAKRYQYYVPLDPTLPGNGLVMRFRGAPQAHAEMVRQALQPLMPGMSYVTTQPLEELVTRAQRSWRLGATMFLMLSGLAVVVAAVGLYGVISYSVAQRRREMSVRAALGARSADLVRLVVGPNLRLTGAGILLGSVLALAARDQVQPLLFGQSATDPTAFLLAAVVLGVAAIAASLAPALRAARVPPGDALRAE
jgi:putative ABC transport system permease protein